MYSSMGAPGAEQPANRAAGLQIAVVTETYPPEVNGVAIAIYQLIGGLRSRGHDLSVVRPRPLAERGQGAAGPVAETVTVHSPLPPAGEGLGERASEPAAYPLSLTLSPLPGGEGTKWLPETLVARIAVSGYRGLLLTLPVSWRLRRLWRRTRPDLVYIATQGPLGHAALSAAEALRIPVVTGFHTQYQRFSHHYAYGFLLHHIVSTQQHFQRHADATLVPSADLKGGLTAAGFANVHVLGRGVDVELFAPTRRDERLRAAWGCGPDDLVVLNVGPLDAEADLDLVRGSFEAIEARHPEARLVLVGDGPARADLQRDHPRFIYAGAKVGEELAAHYASADLLLFPRFAATFDTLVPEAMASGLAVVAFDYAAAHDHIDSWENGVTVQLGDHEGFVAAAADVASDRARLRALGERARRTALEMSWDLVLGGVENLFVEVIRQRREGEGRHAGLAATSE